MLKKHTAPEMAEVYGDDNNMTGYLGPDGTFTKAAALRYCGGTEDMREYRTIYSLLRAVDTGEIKRAVVPIENSVEGIVNITADTLAFDTDIYITHSFIYEIKQNLLAKPGTRAGDIKTLYSKDQAIGQCSRMIEEKLAGTEIIFTQSTAAAAELVASDGETCACIASEETAAIYGLDIIIPECNDRKNNCTRFIVAQKEPPKVFTDDDISSVMFMIENRTGSLFRTMELFSKHSVNMVMIMSRPSKEQLGEYVFFVDFEGNIQSKKAKDLMGDLEAHTSLFKYLGSYARPQRLE